MAQHQPHPQSQGQQSKPPAAQANPDYRYSDQDLHNAMEYFNNNTARVNDLITHIFSCIDAKKYGFRGQDRLVLSDIDHKRDKGVHVQLSELARYGRSLYQVKRCIVEWVESMTGKSYKKAADVKSTNDDLVDMILAIAAKCKADPTIVLDVLTDDNITHALKMCNRDEFNYAAVYEGIISKADNKQQRLS